MNPITGLLAALSTLTVVSLRVGPRPSRQPYRASVAAPMRRTRGFRMLFNCPRLLHKLLRCPGHRLVRYDHCRLSAAQDGARPHHPGHSQRWAHAANGRTGLHLHRDHSGRCPHLVFDDCRSRARRLARRRHCRQVVPARSADRDGSRVAAAATFMLMRQLSLSPPAAKRSAFVGQARTGHRRQFPAGCADDAGNRPVHPVHDPRQPARDERKEPHSPS